MESWIELCAGAELAPGERRLLRHGKLPLVLLRESDGSLRAFDNRCPHEGYPLFDGSRRDGVLSCPWHNFKFRLSDGRCLQGDEDLHLYPVRERERRIEVDLSPPDSAREHPRRLNALAAATLEGRMGQVARELARALESGIGFERLAILAARLDARHGEYGSSHVLPVAADLCAAELPEEERILALMLPYELISEGHRRRPAHAAVNATAADLDLAAHIEAEELGSAQASARRLLREGGWPAVREQLWAACSAHFLDLGHPMIYVSKLDELMARADGESGEEILLGLVRNIVTATREDLLPPMRTLGAFLDHEFVALAAAPPDRLPLGEKREGLRDALLAGDPIWMERLAACLRDGVRRRELLDLLVLCASERLWRFDATLHERTDLQDGWLDVSHTLSFAHALRPLCAREARPHALRALFHAGHFIARCARLDAAQLRRIPSPGSYDADAFARALQLGDEQELLALSLAARENGRLPELRPQLLRWALEASGTRPIFVAHAVKMLRVAFEESVLSSSPLPLLATLRFAVTPKRERAAAALAHDAWRIVAHGRLPRRLAS